MKVGSHAERAGPFVDERSECGDEAQVIQRGRTQLPGKEVQVLVETGDDGSRFLDDGRRCGADFGDFSIASSFRLNLVCLCCCGQTSAVNRGKVET
jgi:hypothetical protein